MERRTALKATYIGLISSSITIMVALYIVFTFSIIRMNIFGLVVTLLCMAIDGLLFGVLLVMYEDEFDEKRNKTHHSES